MINLLYNFFNNKQHNKPSKITIYEQLNILCLQIENIYNHISSTNKFYSTLLSSIVGVVALLYTNKIFPTEYFNYLYYTVLLVYSFSVVWYRTLLMFLFELNTNAQKYNLFIQENNIISMYNLSLPVNVRKCTLQLPFLIGGISLILLLKYSAYETFANWILAVLYVLMFILAFIYKVDIRFLKYM